MFTCPKNEASAITKIALAELTTAHKVVSKNQTFFNSLIKADRLQILYQGILIHM